MKTKWEPRQRQRHRRRSGIALLAALALLALIALLVIGGVATMSLAQRSQRGAQSDALLTGDADYALNTVMTDPATYPLADLPYGQPRVFIVAVPGSDTLAATVAATRLRGGVVWLVASTAFGGLSQAQRRISLVARFPSIGPLPPAAIVSRGPADVVSDVTFPPDTSTDPDCVVQPTADVIVGPGLAPASPGATRYAERSSAADSGTYFIAAGQAAALATVPALVHVRGDTVIAGGSFTGILVVDGSLTISGPFNVSGLLIALGRVEATAGGLTVNGSLMSFANPSGGTPAITVSGATFRYSPCMVARAFRRASMPRATRGRSWGELF